MRKAEKQRLTPLSILVIILILLLAVLSVLLVRELELTNLHRLAEITINLGIIGPIILLLLITVASLTGVIPTTPFSVLAGAIWGWWIGAIIVIIGTQIGAILAFLIARHAALPWVNEVLGSQIKFYTQIQEKYLVRFIFISRIFPFFAFEIISYAAGFTRITFKHYFWATLLGIIPWIIVLTRTGESIINASGPVLWIMTMLALVLLFVFPYVVNKHNPWGIKERLFSTEL